LQAYQFDLGNITDDLKLMAESTHRDCEKTERTLNLRKKILSGGKMEPEKDVRIWTMTIEAQLANLAESIKKCDEILVALADLQKNVKSCSDQLEL